MNARPDPNIDRGITWDKATQRDIPQYTSGSW